MIGNCEVSVKQLISLLIILMIIEIEDTAADKVTHCSVHFCRVLLSGLVRGLALGVRNLLQWVSLHSIAIPVCEQFVHTYGVVSLIVRLDVLFVIEVLINIGSNKPCLIPILVEFVLHSVVNKTLCTALVLNVVSLEFVLSLLNLFLSGFGGLLELLLSHLCIWCARYSQSCNQNKNKLLHFELV